MAPMYSAKCCLCFYVRLKALLQNTLGWTRRQGGKSIWLLETNFDFKPSSVTSGCREEVSLAEYLKKESTDEYKEDIVV